MTNIRDNPQTKCWVLKIVTQEVEKGGLEMQSIKPVIFSLLTIAFTSVAIADTVTWQLWNKSGNPIKVSYASAKGDPAGWTFYCVPPNGPEGSSQTVIIGSGESAKLTLNTNSRQICMGLSYPYTDTPGNWGASYLTLYYPNKHCNPSQLACITDPCPGFPVCHNLSYKSQ